VHNFARLAVQQLGCANDGRAEHRTDCLVTETHPNSGSPLVAHAATSGMLWPAS
jgi:hypothetical protein